jgi:peptidoglycan/xylan/chitin deacetylase (PgdA/CDA1 family)
MVSAAKSLVYKALLYSGANALLLGRKWRQQRLLILCYHGISLADEHEWSGLYMAEEIFRERLELLKAAGCNVIPLDSAVERLKAGKLPPRAVVITFDDGYYDFYAKAWPQLQHFGYPATVYLTTYYSEYNAPVFDPACQYLLWKARGATLDWPEMGLHRAALDTASARSIAQAIVSSVRERRLEGPEKTEILRELASRLAVDFESLCRRRLLHIMTPAEVRELAAKGVDFQLHGHWHRVSRSRERFRNELEQNKAALARCGVSAPAHYCYPTGFHLPEFPAWLAEIGVRSAVTCEMALAAASSDPYLLPRLLDTPGISADAFAAWLSGFGSWMPRKQYPSDPGQLEPDPTLEQRYTAS